MLNSAGVLTFRLLGPVSVTREGSDVPLSGAKIHTVLAVLLMARGTLVADSRLSAALWGDTPPPTSNSQIYAHVSRLRKTLGNCAQIFRKGPGYVLEVREADVDLFAFERLDRLGREALEQNRPEEAGRLLGGALDCWSGQALENVTEHLQRYERPRLEFRRTQALERRIEADLSLGRHRALVPELLSLVARFPLDETLRAHLITALHRCDRQAEAVQVYDDGRRVLDEQLGVVPGRRLGDTYLRMLRGEGADPPPVLLPARAAAFTGRAVEADRLRSLLLGARLRAALVTGGPGSGKSALAVEVAHGCAEAFPGGAVHARLRDPDGTARPAAAVLAELLAALGESGTARAGSDDLLRRYRARSADAGLLVVLDDAAGDAQLRALLPVGRGSAVLVTSRAPLTAVPAEHTLRLGPLDDEDAVRLLGQFAGAGRTRAEPGALRELAGHCAGLSAALRAAGERLAERPRLGVGRLVARFTEPRGRRAVLSRGGPLGADARTLLARVVADGRLAAEHTDADGALAELVDAGLLLREPGGDHYRLHPLALLHPGPTPRGTPARSRRTTQGNGNGKGR
ncbi:AfsR/SARP family transcriptional regulator [Streptomyces sp. NPDC004539]|uniref:AfsR/SARP family transcriptional regulator n=1 Tax=Streptomyces sp. NPDC004539 TaxID=3154280 RepID=UPI0033A07EC8